MRKPKGDNMQMSIQYKKANNFETVMNLGKVDTDSEMGKDALHHGTGLKDSINDKRPATICNPTLRHFQSEKGKA